MLPLSLLKTAQNHPMLVELKNGETYNGHLVSCDNWMNINLREVICTSRDGDKFWRMPECYIRGSTIKYLRIPDEIIDMVKEEVMSKGRGRGGMQQQKQMKGRGAGGAGRGVFGGRGRGVPGGGRWRTMGLLVWCLVLSAHVADSVSPEEMHKKVHGQRASWCRGLSQKRLQGESRDSDRRPTCAFLKAHSQGQTLFCGLSHAPLP
uniref:U6 snRNA-associated Sm-like protein LSm4 n=1 Tax=Xenopus tropicalis TaxID=8364 RepID=A0A803K5Z8_XENTR